MYCYVCCSAYWWLSAVSCEIHVFNSVHLSSGHVSKAVRISGYFSKPKGGPRAKSFGTSDCQQRQIHIDMICRAFTCKVLVVCVRFKYF